MHAVYQATMDLFAMERPGRHSILTNTKCPATTNWAWALYIKLFELGAWTKWRSFLEQRVMGLAKYMYYKWRHRFQAQLFFSFPPKI